MYDTCYTHVQNNYVELIINFNHVFQFILRIFMFVYQKRVCTSPKNIPMVTTGVIKPGILEEVLDSLAR